MTRIPCFLIEETNRTKVYLRRYQRLETKQDCPYPGHSGYHQAMALLGEEPVERSASGYIINGSKPLLPSDDPRWPTGCLCGSYTFTQQDKWQRFTQEVYRRADTGEELTLRDAPPGAMWYAWWYDDTCHPQGPHALVVRLPDKSDWIVDFVANNCNWPGGDTEQAHHHCWPYKGTPPNITVSKDVGTTSTAGAGSILTPHYHGFLRNGFLED